VSALRAFASRLRGLVGKLALDAELDEELQAHLELLTEEHVRRGLPLEEARLAARRDFGGSEQVKEAYRDQRSLPCVEALLQDVRFGLRVLARNPGFTAVAVLTLGLGIGANTAIFSLVNAVLVASLPVRDPDRLVVIEAESADSETNYSFSYPMYADLRDRGTAFSAVAGFAGAQVNLSHAGSSEQAVGELVTGNYFETLGVRPWLGRLLTPADDRTPGGHPVVVLSHDYWQRRFGAEPAIVGRAIVLNGRPMTVVGVSPPGFYGTQLGHAIDVRVPMMMAAVFRPFPANRLQNRRHQWMTLMARLRPDVSRAEAEASAAALYRHLRETELPQLAGSDYARRQFLAQRLRLRPGGHGLGQLRRALSRPLLLLQGVTAIVLLIACANLANLLLARNAARRQEVAVRVALGAGRGRLLRQWLTESLLLSLAGGLVGLALAFQARAALRWFLGPGKGDALQVPIDGSVLVFTLAVATATGLVAGLAPALGALRHAVASTLRGEALAVAGGDRLLSLRGGLVLAQVALALPLLVAAGLFLHSLRNLHAIETGFAKRNVLLGSLNPSLNGYSQERIAQFYREVLERVRALPGVGSASLAMSSALSGGWDCLGVVVEGYVPREGEDMTPNANSVTPGYFATLGMPLVAGRDFSETDVAGRPRVAIVNETMARYYFGERTPIGRRFTTDDRPGAPIDIEIVGVVRDAKYVDLREKTPRHFYLPIWQEPRLFDLTLHARTLGDPQRAVGAIRSALRGIDATVPLYGVTTLETQVDASLAQERLVTWLSSLFGLLAVVLAAIGLYGVVAFSVARRTREIGVRVALGAGHRDIVRLVLRQIAGVVGFGLLVGAVLAVTASRALGSLLYEVAATDALTYAGASTLLALVAALAAYLPARRAAKVDPVTALRYE
jgi:predicted permease